MEIFAHRGLVDQDDSVVENSMRALADAIAAGYSIETDVRWGRDRAIVVFHDADLTRLFGDSRRTLDVSAKDISSLHEKRSGHTEPTSADFCSLLRWPPLHDRKPSRSVLVNIKQPDEVDFILDVCREIVRAKCERSTWVFDIDQDLIPEVKEACPEVRLLARLSHLTGESVERVGELAACADGIWFDDYFGELLGSPVEQRASLLELPMFFVSPELHADTHPRGRSGFEESWRAVLRNPAFVGVCTDLPHRLRRLMADGEMEMGE